MIKMKLNDCFIIFILNYKVFDRYIEYIVCYKSNWKKNKMAEFYKISYLLSYVIKYLNTFTKFQGFRFFVIVKGLCLYHLSKIYPYLCVDLYSPY